MKKIILDLLEESFTYCIKRGLIPTCAPPFLEVEPTKDSRFGDYTTNCAMVIAAQTKIKPIEIAKIITSNIKAQEQFFDSIEIAGPGFINFFVKKEKWYEALEEIERRGNDFGKLSLGKGKSLQVEFVSANPTGPLHIGHARGAVVGDVLANIFAACGYRVSREYYINDAGNQMHNLGNSVYLRYLELMGEEIKFPENGYRGDYIKDLAQEIIKKDGRKWQNNPLALTYFTDYASSRILEEIKTDLRDFGVIFDSFFSEKDLYKNGEVQKLLDYLESKGFIYREGTTLWFKSTAFGDDKDRVVVRKSGEPTYFAADIAYHKNKFDRGFDKVVDVWGADHHGYIPRLLAAIQALGHNKEDLQIVLVQIVNLLREGKPVAMSTRGGEFVTMKEVVEEVGKDAARYNFLMRRSDSHLDFDLELAKKQSNENPVYYVQYAHARICSIFKNAKQKGYEIPIISEIDPTLLALPEEMAMIKTIVRFPEIIEGAARSLEPHRLTFYLNDLAALFHNYYNKHKVVSQERELTLSRLFLVKCIKTVVANALKLLGVSSPEEM